MMSKKECLVKCQVDNTNCSGSAKKAFFEIRDSLLMSTTLLLFHTSIWKILNDINQLNKCQVEDVFED